MFEGLEPDNDRASLIAIGLLVFVLLFIRACLPSAMHHSAEVPHTPPESFYR